MINVLNDDIINNYIVIIGFNTYSKLVSCVENLLYIRIGHYPPIF